MIVKKKLIQIPSVSHLKCDYFKQNIKKDNFTEQALETLSFNSDNSHYSSSIINICHYLAENYEDRFIPVVGDYSLTYSGKMSVVEATSITSDVGFNIFQLRILLRILQNRLGVKMFEPKHLMKTISGDMILPKFGEYNYYHEGESKPEIF